MYTPLMRFRHWPEAAGRSDTVQPADTGQRSGQARQPQSAVPRSPPSVTHIMGYYASNRPRRDGRLSLPCWLTDSRRFTHKVVKQPSIILAQNRESSLAKTDVLTTMLRHQRSFPLVFHWGKSTLKFVAFEDNNAKNAYSRWQWLIVLYLLSRFLWLQILHVSRA